MTKEVRSQMKERKRREAEERNARTPHDQTKAHRLKRCTCDTPEGRLLTSIFGVHA